MQKNQHMQMMQMQREHSDIDMNGHRQQSPSSAENAPSPSKRPRLEGGPMNGQQLAPNGRGQGQAMPGQPNPALLMQNGLTPRPMNPNQFGAFQQSGPATQPKSLQVYAHNLALHHTRSAMNNQGMPNGLMNPGVMPNQGDMVPMPDGPNTVYPMSSDFYNANGQMPQVRAGVQNPGGGQHGNHALQDYQMQLMLLEQQNKRRLMMARQEQDSINASARGADGPPLAGQQAQQQPGPIPPSTSPQGSRTGASPIPNEQMKRNTPKISQSGLPNSPNAPDAMMQGRGSPASMNFTGQMPPEMAPQFFMKNNLPDGIPGPNGLRPPSSNPAFSGPQMGQPVPAGGPNRMPNGGTWQPQPGGQPMVPQQSPIIQNPNTGTPQSVNSMPPPQAPPAANAGRQPPPSPQTGAAAPPTPQQGTKSAPKRRETKDKAKVCFRALSTKSRRVSLLTYCSGQTRKPRPQLRPQLITQQLRHLLRPNSHQLLHQRRQSHLNTISLLTNPARMPLRVLRNSRHLPPPNKPSSSLPLLIKLSNHSTTLLCLT